MDDTFFTGIRFGIDRKDAQQGHSLRAGKRTCPFWSEPTSNVRQTLDHFVSHHTIDPSIEPDSFLRELTDTKTILVGCENQGHRLQLHTLQLDLVKRLGDGRKQQVNDGIARTVKRFLFRSIPKGDSQYSFAPPGVGVQLRLFFDLASTARNGRPVRSNAVLQPSESQSGPIHFQPTTRLIHQ